MKKDKIRRRIPVEANGEIPAPPYIDSWKLKDKHLRVAVYCSVATLEQTECSKICQTRITRIPML